MSTQQSQRISLREVHILRFILSEILTSLITARTTAYFLINEQLQLLDEGVLYIILFFIIIKIFLLVPNMKSKL